MKQDIEKIEGSNSKIPDFCNFILERLKTNGHILFYPDQLIISEYEPGY